ncbi:DNA-formamidopyrimidine glycosylase [Staphylococcus hyicus]|uniref:bifunctional DNA-formamidopyrimidine glycosylase/DNA-(apurinic or apyrimidinic site) lyase n=1 Tax=Staphylococcus hyicus TaxID=1284 RepID=UPI000D1E78A8|nr:bifunctional DNA-formamidopyrimidine glycosylase/DNA-(apurinic or apyrimidinic site) lyase [Staphylococcus hyicus]MDP4448139.1 bifunctional DNA-formamidopyrimidine glycosylase/DNA-(apurinic or apyrimidinic site) lyase [Staphylococcus hyicus]PTJ71917.1 DNA-formamidopyrimidine glycosylase [Staphylococcus hyicus]PTJ89566.1 DNA-formamidopyrimidine glycosylase [Staphylococcus hyicus]
MPELPEVEHVKRGIQPFIEGAKIVDITFSDSIIVGKAHGKDTIIKGISLESFKTYTLGYTIKHVDRRSKYILFDIVKDTQYRQLISHLGMAGGFFVVKKIEDINIANYRKHWHVAFHLDNDWILVYSDIRRFGEIRNVESLEAYPSILEIAPEPFDAEALPHYLAQFEVNRFKKMPIKRMILEHRVISGCGNIYACEALFNAKVNPHRLAQDLSHEERINVFHCVVKVLEMGILHGGTSISDYVHADGQRGTMQNNLKVYKQKTCSECQCTIETAIIGGRNTHYCKNCQT